MSIDQEWMKHNISAAWYWIRSKIESNEKKRKRYAELAYWSRQRANDPDLVDDHYKYYYTDYFDLSDKFYRGSRILDIGCGPRGSLEWANMARERIGLDPLANQYQDLIAGRHSMEYVAARAENLPFENGSIDVCCSFNSLDHVDNIDMSINEIKRVVTDGGTLLLITDVNHPPTVTEPVSFSWDITDEFAPEFEVIYENHREKSEGGVYQSASQGEPYDHENPERRYGVLSAKLKKST
jgi:ubiquinone/menaquinone biosynthesis C-methylase UbiE